MGTTYKSEIFAAIYETVSDLHEAGLVDKRTMRRFDESCLTPVNNLSPDEIKAIRVKSQVSQSVFAHYLNVSPGVVSQWERGEKHPAGTSLKLLVLVRNKGLEAIA
jgi:putative transcriptional regulator